MVSPCRRVSACVQREIARLKATGEDDARLKRLQKQYVYYGNVTCAADGLCSTSCPMKINTGDLTHDLRNAAIKPNSFTHKVGEFCADNVPAIRSGIKLALRSASLAQAVIGEKGVETVGKAIHAAGGSLWTPSLPKAYSAHEIEQAESKKKVVYFPSCLNQTMGKGHKGPTNQPCGRSGDIPQQSRLGSDIPCQYEEDVLRYDLGKQGYA